MPSGKFTITDIPTQADVDELREEYMLEAAPPEIVVGRNGPPFTMVATYPGTGSETESFSDR